MALEKIGRYQILKILGSGGFGEVYLGHDPHIRRDVAIKVFHPKDENLIAFATSSVDEGLAILRQRFVDEAHILANLEEAQYVINVLDFGELEDGSPWYTMPYLTNSLANLIGKDVFDVLAIDELEEDDKPRAVELTSAIKYITQITEGLAAAHAKRLVHRDIKPANILLTDSDQVRIADFGIAKAPDGQQSTVSHLGMGSRNYMAPEQRESAKHVEASADIYSIGVLAYRLLTGRLPTGRYADPNVYQQGLSPALNTLLLACLSEDRNQRPANATQLLAQLSKAKTQAITNDDATSATMVEGPSAKLRDEVVPLKNRIKALLLQHGEMPTNSKAELMALAAIAEVDDDGIKALIKEVSQDHKKEIIPKRNFIKHLDKQIAENPGGIPEAELAALVTAGASVGFDKHFIQRRFTTAHPKQDNIQVVSGANQVKQQLSSEPTSAKSQTDRTDDNEEPQKHKKGSKGLAIFFILFIFGLLIYAINIPKPNKQNTGAIWSTVPKSDIKQSSTPNSKPVQGQAEEELAAQTRIAQEQAALEKLAGKLVKIPSGSFQMGSNESADEKPIHTVNVSSFTMQEAEVTKGQFAAFIADTGYNAGNECYVYKDKWVNEAGKNWRNPGFSQTDKDPVVCVNWNDVQAYIKWLNKQTGKRFRLPSEAEWEYAARAGSSTKYSWGNSISKSQAKYANASGKPAAVKSYAPNGFGLYDMHGNVYEWVQDCYHDSYSGAPSNGNARTSCNSDYFVLRGGSFSDGAGDLRSAGRILNSAGSRYYCNGFRLVQDR
jgi:formylglycine-generating enzyme required for sulfatase activity/tRNA A-37 threonylcarbamoyl transferase component Bud32